MTGAELKAWVSDIPDDFEVVFQCKDRELSLASMRIAPWDKLTTQYFIEGTVIERPDADEEDDRDGEPDTLANLGMCEADFR